MTQKSSETMKEANITTATENVIVHVVNCQGVMGSGVAAALKDRFPGLFHAYRTHWENHRREESLGTCCLYTNIDPDGRITIIANLFAQRRYGYDGGKYISYDALDRALSDMVSQLHNFTHLPKATFAIPYNMGACRAGGNWNVVKALVEAHVDPEQIEIYKYDEKPNYGNKK